jgi:hypothetical protein
MAKKGLKRQQCSEGLNEGTGRELITDLRKNRFGDQMSFMNKYRAVWGTEVSNIGHINHIFEADFVS